MAKQKPDPLYKLIVDNYDSNELRQLCAAVGFNYENLGGDGTPISTRAQNLQSAAARLTRTDVLLSQLLLDRPNLADVLPNYLFMVIMDVFATSSTMVDLLKSFQIEARNFGGREIFSWGDKPWREQKAWALQELMEENGRSDELIAAIKKANPQVDLSFYASVPQEEGESVLGGGPGATGKVDEYMNFDINIAKADGNYQIEISDSPNGQEKAISTLNLEDTGLRDKLTYLAKLRARPTDVEEVGDKLAEFLFPPKISHHFDLSLREAQKNKKNLRVRLRLGLDQPDLSRIPWEYCRINRKFVAQGIETPMVRYLKTNQPDYHPITVDQPVRLLLVTASPIDEKWKQLDVGKEAESVRTAVQPLVDSGKVIVEVLDHASPADLVTSLRRTFKPHILHFIGHGTLQENGEGALVLEDGSAERKPSLIDVDDISQLLDATDVSLVILSACETAAHEASEAIMGIAPRLVWDGMPAVIAMQYAVPDTTAGLFAKELYTFLTDYYPLDKAVTEARITTYFTSKDKAYWGIPVLFMRAPDGRLWQP